MAVPDEAILEALIAEGEDLGFATGTAAIDLAAMSIAWEQAEAFVATNLLSGTACDEINYPTGWADANVSFKYVQLSKAHVSAIESLTLGDEECECDLDDSMKIVNGRLGIVQVCGCGGSGCGVCGSWCGASCEPWPGRLTVCYTAGLWDDLASMPVTVKMALFLLASWWSGVFSSGGAEASTGALSSWRSMDYSESYNFLTQSTLGSSPQASAAYALLRPHRVMRAVAIRGHYPTLMTRGVL